MPAHASDQPIGTGQRRLRCGRINAAHVPFGVSCYAPFTARLVADDDVWGSSPPARVGVHALGGGVDAPSTQRPGPWASLPAGTSSGGSCPRRCVLSRTGPRGGRPTQRGKWGGRGGGCSGHAARRPAFATDSRRPPATSRMARRESTRRRPMRMAGTPARWPSRRTHSWACERLMPSARAASPTVIVSRSLMPPPRHAR